MHWSKPVFIVLICLLQFTADIFAVNLDSLQTVLSNKHGFDRLPVLNELAYGYSADDPAKAMQFATEALNLSRNLKAPKEEARALYNLAEISFNLNDLNAAIGYYTQSAEVTKNTEGQESKDYIDRLGDIGFCYNEMNKYDKSIGYFESAVQLALKTGYDSEAATNYSNLATIYTEWGDYARGLTYFQKAMEIDRKNGRRDQISVDLNNIGKIYELSGKPLLAIHYYEEALEIERKAGNKARIAIRLNNLGTVYKSMKKYPQALTYLRQALEIEQSLGDEEKVGKRLAYIGATYLDMNDFEQSYPYLQQALSILSKTELHDDMARLQNTFGNYYLARHDYQNALEHLLLSQQHAQFNNLKPLQLSNLKLIAEVYEKTGQAEKALGAFKQFQAVKDSVFTRDSERAMAEFQARYENEKIQIENELLRNDAQAKKRIYILSGVLSVSLISILVAVILILRLRARNSRQLKEIAEKNSALLKEEVDMKNHELTLNAMSIIRSNEVTTQIVETIEKALREGQPVDVLESVLQQFKTLERDKSWKEFEIRFSQVHKEFYEKLTTLFPDLTPNEIKLCAFLRLNMTTKDISAITTQSIHSINVARTRLRKKMNLANSDENLISYLMKL